MPSTWVDDLRAVFPRWGTDRRDEGWSAASASLHVGQSVSGTVVARAEFGVWVDIGAGFPALLFVVDMADRGRPIAFEDYPEKGTRLAARIRALGARGEIGLAERDRGEDG